MRRLKAVGAIIRLKRLHKARFMDFHVLLGPNKTQPVNNPSHVAKGGREYGMKGDIHTGPAHR